MAASISRSLHIKRHRQVLFLDPAAPAMRLRSILAPVVALSKGAAARGVSFCDKMAGQFMPKRQADFDRDEVMVCMVLAFCIAGVSIEVIYRLLG